MDCTQVLSDGIYAGFTGADTDNFFDVRDENLAVADASRLGSLADGFDGAVHGFVCDDDFNFHLGKKVDDIFGAAVKLGMAFLSSKALGFDDSDPLQADFLKGLLHFI